MSKFIATEFQGSPLHLFLADPNWATPPETRYTLENKIESNWQRRETRRPLHEALRMRLSIAYTLEMDDGKALDAELDGLLDEYIGIPLPMDKLPPERWGERVHDAEFVINFDDAGAFAIFHKTELPDIPPHPWLAPLLVGRFDKRPELKLITDQSFATSFTLVENSPWEMRTAPATQTWEHGWPSEVIAAVSLDAVNYPQGITGGINYDSDKNRWWPWFLTPDWASPPTETTDTIVEYKAVGRGRLAAVEGAAGGVRKTQECKFTLGNRRETRIVLNHFLTVQGRNKNFVVPWAFYPRDNYAGVPSSTQNPGDPSAPIARRVRYSADTLTLKWLTGETAVTTLKFTAPREINSDSNYTADGEAEAAPSQPAFAHLYTFNYDVPAANGGPVTWRLTDYEAPITRNGDTWAPALIVHDKIVTTGDFSDDPVKLTARDEPGHPFKLILAAPASAPLRVTIEFVNLPAGSLPALDRVLFKGLVTSVKKGDAILEASCKRFAGLFETKLPRFLLQPSCNHQFGGPWCRFDLSTLSISGTVDSVSVSLGNSPSISVRFSPLTSFDGVFSKQESAPDYWANGILEGGVGVHYEQLTLVRVSNVINATDYVLVVFVLRTAPRWLAAADVVTLRPQCSGTWAECLNRYNNTLNFGGHPRIPQQNPSVPTLNETANQGKK
ncbi:MAG: DUF2163 domain-containing protein [Opitutaceae bacterium]|jgi:hypothetical protein|nr:DUF2163 domain-containing protein [Opitutaceae bacterium]